MLKSPQIPLTFRLGGHCYPWPDKIETTVQCYQSEWELLTSLAGSQLEERGQFQRIIARALDHDPICKSWFKERAPRKSQPHFLKYQQSEYETYHEAAGRVLGGRPDTDDTDHARFNGLIAEIQASGVVTACGAIVFHGRVRKGSICSTAQHGFLSTSLDPVVAINSAFRRGFDAKICDQDPSLQKQILMIELAHDMPAIWGQYTQSHEYELLFAPPLDMTIITSKTVDDFELLHVEMSCLQRESKGL